MSKLVGAIKVFKNNGKNETFVGRGEVTIAEAVTVKFNVVNGKKGLFVSLPSRSYKDKEGNTKYENQVIVGEDLYKELQTAILKEFKGLDSKPAPVTQNDDNIPF